MAKILSHCPVCEAILGISELACGRCQTRIHGAFDPCRFCRLAPEHLAFIELFLRCEGNLSRVEKELGVSYPTVRSRFSAALAALGFAESAAASEPRPEPSPSFSFSMASSAAPHSPTVANADAAARRREVLDALARGTMSAEDAANALRDLS